MLVQVTLHQKGGLKMKKIAFLMTAIFICCSSLAPPVYSSTISLSEARTVGENWVRFIIHNGGQWGEYDHAEVVRVEEFKRDRRVLGYICFVNPAGCIVVPRSKRLSPVRYHSASGELDPRSDQGPAGLVKDRLEADLDWMAKVPAATQLVAYKKGWKVKPSRYQRLWAVLTTDPAVFLADLDAGLSELNYQGGDPWLLTTWWEQAEPYNAQTPNMGCSWPCDSNTNALVGCPATAGSQIMKHWNWPPYGTDGIYADFYDWANMPDSFIGCTWDPAAVDATAELNSEVGIAFSSSYGCDITGGGVSFVDVLPHFRYFSISAARVKSNFTPEAWHAFIRADLDQNRPVYYGIPGHQIVIDGWQETEPGPLIAYHINYGYGDEGHSGWFAIDDIPGGDPEKEGMINEVYPDVALGPLLSGAYPKAKFPYRYFDQDAKGDAATFFSGQYLQFLHNITVRASSSPGSTILFYGYASGNNTLLFSRGNPSKGIRIYNGAVKLNSNGGIRFF
jgi:hypothetical protein